MEWYFLNHFTTVLKNYIFLTILLFALEFFRKESKLIKRESLLREKLTRVELENLKSQFQPHFLFNALNSIVAVVDENKRKAQTMLIQLSDILRISIDNDYNCRHTLADEIRFLKKYLSIEKIRYEDQLNYSFNISKKALDVTIPCLITQPMIENAIKHGYKGEIETLSIIIKATGNGEKITIANNGADLKKHDLGKGLSGTYDRINVIYGKQSSLKLYQEGDWVINEIILKKDD